MERKKILGIAVAICLAIFILVPFMAGCAAKETPAPAPAAETINLRIQSAYGTKSFPCIWILDWMGRVASGSEGRVTFTFYPQSSLMGRKQAWDGIQQRILDLGDTGPGYDVGRMGLVGKSQWMAGNWVYESFVKNARNPGSYYDWAKPYYDNVGLKLLDMPMTFPQILHSSKPINKIEDLQGQRFRDSGGMAGWQEAIGIIPMPIEGGDFYEAVQRGVIEGGVQDSGGLITQKWYEVTPHVMESNVMGPANMAFVMNLQAWNDLPDDLKQLFIQSTIESDEWLLQNNTEIAEKNKKELLSYPGTTWYKTTDEEDARLLKMLDPFFADLQKEYGEAEWNKYLEMRKTIR